MDERKTLVDLLPHFLRVRRVSWPGMATLLADAGMERPQLFLLRAIVEETEPGQGLTLAELRAELFNPYGTVHGFVPLLPALAASPYVTLDAGCYTATPAGRALVERMEREVRAWMAQRDLAPLEDVAQLADTLLPVAAQLWAAPEPQRKAHQARAWRLPPLDTAAPLPRLDQAVYALWMARDDANTAAWRAQGFDGPTFDVLSHAWMGELSDLGALPPNLEHGQTPADVARAAGNLAERGLLVRDGTRIALTEPGRALRTQIERETDRIYFAPWPTLTAEQFGAMRSALERVIAALTPQP